jgi:hypothetical protein
MQAKIASLIGQIGDLRKKLGEIEDLKQRIDDLEYFRDNARSIMDVMDVQES